MSRLVSEVWLQHCQLSTHAFSVITFLTHHVNSFLQLCYSLLMNDSVSTNHKTYCDFSLSLNIINSVEWCEKDSGRYWDVVALSEHQVETPGVWKNYLSDGIQCCHFHCFMLHEPYFIDVEHPIILLWRPCIKLCCNTVHRQIQINQDPPPQDSQRTQLTFWCLMSTIVVIPHH